MKLYDWPHFGLHQKGPKDDGNIYCLGGCGGIIDVFPPSIKVRFMNTNLWWCAECTQKFKETTGEDPSYPRKDREWQAQCLCNY